VKKYTAICDMLTIVRQVCRLWCMDQFFCKFRRTRRYAKEVVLDFFALNNLQQI